MLVLLMANLQPFSTAAIRNFNRKSTKTSIQLHGRKIVISPNLLQSLQKEPQRNTFPDFQRNFNLTNFVKFHSRCSGKFLQSYGKRVNAKGIGDSPLVDYMLIGAGWPGKVRIMSRFFGTFLCLNRRRKITMRVNGRSRKCIFTEKLTYDHYTELEAVKPSGFLLAFDFAGHFLDLNSISPNILWQYRRCAQFLKIPPSYNFSPKKNSQNGPSHWQLFSSGGNNQSSWQNAKHNLKNTEKIQKPIQNRIQGAEIFVESVFSKLRVTQPPSTTATTPENDTKTQNLTSVSPSPFGSMFYSGSETRATDYGAGAILAPEGSGASAINLEPTPKTHIMNQNTMENSDREASGEDFGEDLSIDKVSESEVVKEENYLKYVIFPDEEFLQF